MQNKKYFCQGIMASLFSIGSLILTISTILGYIFLSDNPSIGKGLLICIPALLPLIICLFSVKEYMKKISINEDGIEFYFFNKKIQSFMWDEIKSVDVYRAGYLIFYRFHIKNTEECIMVNITKPIAKLVNTYTPNEIYIGDRIQ